MPKPTSELPESEVLPDPAQEKRQYRKFSAAEKQRILDAAEKCTQPGQLGALLRKEEIYSSQLNRWRKQQQQFGKSGLDNQPVGRKRKDPIQAQLEKLERENRQLTQRLERAEGLLDLQKKAFTLLEQINTGISS